MPDPRLETAIDLAKRCGTYGEIDRRAQYQGELDDLDGFQLRRKLQSKYDQLFAGQRRLEKEKFRHRALLMVGAAFLARLPDIYTWLQRIF